MLLFCTQITLHQVDIFQNKKKLHLKNSSSLGEPSHLFFLSNKRHFSPHPHEKIYTFDLKIVEKLLLVNETWYFEPHCIKRMKLQTPWHIGLFIFLFVKYPMLSMSSVSNTTCLKQICKGHLEETLGYFLTSTEQEKTAKYTLKFY